jgi:uncharacterized protein YqgC (DUF456 family)
VEDARFCHKCGRPTREEFGVEQEAAEMAQQESVPPPLPGVVAGDGEYPPAALPEIGFQNKVAVRIAALLAGPMFLLTKALSLLPAGTFFVFAGLFATGLVAVILYRRRTGATVSIMSGARMGWISGIFIFLILLIIMTAQFALAEKGEVVSEMQKQLQAQGQSKEEIELVANLFNNPIAILMVLVMLFAMITTLPSLGGALGAKLIASPDQQDRP